MAPKRSAPAAPEDDYDSWSAAKLKSRLQELGATASGGKAALVERLRTLEPVMAKAKGKAKAKAEEPAPPKRGAPAAAKEPPPAAPKRGAPPKAAAKEEPAPPPKRGAPKARAAAEATEEAPAKKAKAEAVAKPAAQQKRTAEGEPKESTAASISGPSQVFYEDGDFCAEYAKSSRSACKRCGSKIEAGALRIGKQVPSDKFDGMVTTWNHWPCFIAGGLLPKSTQLIAGLSSLKPADQSEISSKIPKSAGEGGGKVDKKLEEAVKKQSEKIHEILDVLGQLGDAQIKDLLELNDYAMKKWPDRAATKREVVADGILFGACQKCQVCGGNLVLSGEGYRCKGWVTEFLKCTFKTQEPERAPFELTQSAKNAGGGKLGKMKMKTGKRLFAHEMRDEDDISASQGSTEKRPPFLGLTIVVHERGDTKSKAKLEQLIKANGGSVADAVTKVAACVVSHSGVVADEDEEDPPEVAEAKEHNVPGVGEAFIMESVEAGELKDMTPYLLWGKANRKKIEEGQTSKFIEKMGVNMDADVGELAETVHVLVEKSKKRVWSEMLTRTDVATGSNSFYTMHLLESDDASSRKYWIFRKWGRIGVSQGGTKLQEFNSNLSGAQQEFKKQYLDKTGNSFDDNLKDFAPKNGKFVRIDMEHKALGKTTKGDAGGDAGGAGEGGGGNDQPLGKLSKAQIEKGDAVLDKVQALLNEGAAATADPVAKAQAHAKFSSFSAEFYTLIPHNFGAKKPPVINNNELLGAEKALLQFYLRMGFAEMDGEEEAKLTPISGVMELPCPSTLAEAANAVCGKGDITSCLKKGTPMHKKKAGKPLKPMTPDLYGALLLYTSNAIYKQLNKALRDEDRTTVEKFFPYLRFLFEACARLPQQKRTLWRGVGVDLFPQYKVGSTIIWWGVSSCTSDEAVARNFMAGCGDGATFLTVETQTACDISEVSFYANEAESILLPGTQLEVLSAEKKGKKSEIRLREVGRVVS